MLDSWNLQYQNQLSPSDRLKLLPEPTPQNSKTYHLALKYNAPKDNQRPNHLRHGEILVGHKHKYMSFRRTHIKMKKYERERNYISF